MNADELFVEISLMIELQNIVDEFQIFNLEIGQDLIKQVIIIKSALPPEEYIGGLDTLLHCFRLLIYIICKQNMLLKNIYSNKFLPEATYIFYTSQSFQQQCQYIINKLISMHSFGIISQKPRKTQSVSFSRTQNVAPKLKVEQIQQPKPNLMAQENIHIIDKRRNKIQSVNIKLQSTNIHLNQNENKQFNSVKQKPQQIQQIQQKSLQHTAEKTQRKPIFRKVVQQKFIQNGERVQLDKISIAESIHLTETDDKISQSSQNYYMSSIPRKMKGQKNPYADTYRIKNQTSRKNRIKSEPDHNMDVRVSSPVEQREDNPERTFKKKQVFEEGITEKKGQEKLLAVPRERTKKKKIFDRQKNRSEEKEKQKQIGLKQQKKQRPQFIKLRPRGYVQKKLTQSAHLSATSSSQSLQVFSFQPMPPMIL